jgi:hypothetical protein
MHDKNQSVDPLEACWALRAATEVYPRFLQARPRWPELATLLRSETAQAIEAALLGAQVDALKICPRGSWQSRGHFKAASEFGCCKPLRGAGPQMSVHGHCASTVHLCNELGAPGSLVAASELRRVLLKSLVCGFQMQPGSDAGRVIEAIHQLLETAWDRLLGARLRGSRWAMSDEHAGAYSELMAVKLNQRIAEVASEQASAGLRPLAPIGIR